MHLKQSQQGMTLISWTFIMMLVVFSGSIILHVILLYMQDYKIKNCIESLATGQSNTVASVKEKLAKRFKINDVTAISIDDVEIIRTSEGISVHVVYDAKTNIFRNISVVIHFEHSSVVTN